jgi:hypothetical protein
MEAPSPVTALLRPGHGEDTVESTGRECVISRPDQRRGSKEQGQTGVYLVWR